MSEKTGFAAMLKLGLVLALYAAAACVGLAFVYTGTKDIIAQRQQEELDAALNELFAGAEFTAIDNITIADPDVTIAGDESNPSNTGAFAATENGDIIGVALRTSRASYNGLIVCLVGVGADGKIKGVKILEHSDTPGLGANAASENYYIDRANGVRFYDQFTGMAAGDSFVPRDDVQAITAATITSAAVSSSVKAAAEAAVAWMENGGSR